MVISITATQRHFLQCAINLSESVIDFTMPDVEFKEYYGCTKKEMREELENLWKSIYLPDKK